MAKKSNQYGVILMRKSRPSDFLAWTEAWYEKMKWVLTCNIGVVNTRKLFRMLERKLRNERIAEYKRGKSK